MTEDIPKPLIGQGEQSLFAIPDTRDRANRLREQLTPRLALILEWACENIKDAYGADSLEHYRIVLTPANRRNASKTMSYEDASAGIALKTKDGEHHPWYFQQRIECSKSHLIAKLFGKRGREASPIVSVLNRHKHEAARLLEYRESFLWQPGIYGEEEDQYDLISAIERLKTGSERDWSSGLSIEGPNLVLPVLDRDSVWPTIYDFVALFPIFRAATNVLLGDEDQFPVYSSQFWDWDETLVEAEEDDSTSEESSVDDSEESHSANEGAVVFRLKQHRIREAGLRKKKLREVLRRGDGRLRCQVPGCEFDYFEVYGHIGKNFAHVHHLEPLGGRTTPSWTRMADLVIVCANCHAMIHRGGGCRPLEGLIASNPA